MPGLARLKPARVVRRAEGRWWRGRRGRRGTEYVDVGMGVDPEHSDLAGRGSLERCQAGADGDGVVPAKVVDEARLGRQRSVYLARQDTSDHGAAAAADQLCALGAPHCRLPRSARRPAGGT